VLPADPEIFVPLIQEAERSADLVVVHIHWGAEYNSKISPRERDLARVMVDIGADYRESLPLSGEMPAYYIGVPGLVKGMAEAHRDFGSLPLEELLEPSSAWRKKVLR
jgi:hypothetical protein